MQIEGVTLFGVFILIMFAFAVVTKRNEIGIIAALFLMVLGFWILTSGIQWNDAKIHELGAGYIWNQYRD
jgi:lipopolysaccharide export LptBFGC system permease protein LptF